MDILSKDSAIELCDSIEIDSSFFDESNEEFILLKENNPRLLTAYEELFALAYGEEAHRKSESEDEEGDMAENQGDVEREEL